MKAARPAMRALANTRFALIARPRDALDSAIAVARAAGFEVADLGELEGEAREVAAAHAQMAREAHAAGRKLAILSGGELTVTVRGRGRGGPNQEYVLALVSALRDLDGIAALAADTDGADGGGGSPDDPAGAFFDAASLRKMASAGLDPDAYLAEQRRDHLLRADLRSPDHRADAHQRQRRPRDPDRSAVGRAHGHGLPLLNRYKL